MVSDFESIAEAEDVTLPVGRAGHDVIQVEEVEGGTGTQGTGGAGVVAGLFPLAGGYQITHKFNLPFHNMNVTDDNGTVISYHSISNENAEY